MGTAKPLGIYIRNRLLSAMTEQMAKQVFDILLNSIQRNGFNDIGTFLISSDQRLSDAPSDYQYRDTDTELTDLEILSARTNGARVALLRLLDAVRLYFDLASSMPQKFKQKLISLDLLMVCKPFIRVNLNLYTGRPPPDRYVINPTHFSGLYHGVHIVCAPN